MSRSLRNYKDILQERRNSNNFMWVSRELIPQIAFKQYKKLSASQLKLATLNRTKITVLIQKISEGNDIALDETVTLIKQIIDEIGYSKNTTLIRWLGFILVKCCLKVCSGIHVDEIGIQRVKSVMGNAPVIFLPSHRSYADFIIMSFICFTYNLAIPAIAAGMDFHGMWGMGTVLRNTGAFFMRRSYNSDSVYWEVFREYFDEILCHGDLPIEFFIEGTRSRTGKSLLPKLGLLSMVLKAFLGSKIPEAYLVPINISYDRVMEERLFAYEHLGIPKPKETTSGFFKSLSILKEHFGNLYITFGEPISLRQFFDGKVDKTVHNFNHKNLQLTEQEKKLALELGYDVVHRQQKNSVITITNIIALILSTNMYHENRKISTGELKEKITVVKNILEHLGAFTDIDDVTKQLNHAMNVHEHLICVDREDFVHLVEENVVQPNLDPSKIKGHLLSSETMKFAIPLLKLQLYVNPVLHYLIAPSIIVTLLKRNRELTKEETWKRFTLLRSLLCYEFIRIPQQENQEFQESLQHLQILKVITMSNETLILEETDNDVEELLFNSLQPFLLSYFIVCATLQSAQDAIHEKSVFVSVQANIETLFQSDKFVHPYSVSLDVLGNCINGLCEENVLRRDKSDRSLLLKIDVQRLDFITSFLENYLSCEVDKSNMCIRSGSGVTISSKL